ncbi:MAG: hypothetical protein J6J00_05655 [Treponema sp.]|nr:hypothetical protein [Treponema sp.]
MENKIEENDTEEFYKRFMFLKKHWLKFLVFPLVWIAILSCRDLIWGDRVIWKACLFLYAIKSILYIVHYCLVKNYPREKMIKAIQNYIGHLLELQICLFALFFVLGCVYLFTGKGEGIVFYTVLLCSGTEDVLEYFELKRVF